MNAQRRKDIDEAISKVMQAQELMQCAWLIINDVKDNEEDAFDNLPSSIQDGEKGEIMQEAIDELGEAIDLDFDDLMEEFINHCENAKGQ